MKLYRKNIGAPSDKEKASERIKLADEYQKAISAYEKSKSQEDKTKMDRLKAQLDRLSDGKENDLDPKDREKIKQLRDALKRASDEMDDHEGAPKYEAAFKAAQKDYDDFMDNVKPVDRKNAKDQEIESLRKENAALKAELKSWKENV